LLKGTHCIWSLPSLLTLRPPLLINRKPWQPIKFVNSHAFSNTTNFLAQQQDKKALSLALGAALLSHKVEELERSVSTRPNGATAGSKMNFARAVDNRAGRNLVQEPPERRAVPDEVNGSRNGVENAQSLERGEKPASKKDADIVVVDASVLIHAIGQLKAWCRNGREEVIIVPLEGAYTCSLWSHKR
jgi:hypothetical protein